MHESSFNAAIETPPSEGCLFELPNIYVELELHKQGTLPRLNQALLGSDYPTDFDVIFAVCSAKRLITSGDANWNRAIAQTPINLDYANLAQDDYRLAQLTIDQLGEMQLEVEITVKRGRFYESALELPVTYAPKRCPDRPRLALTLPRSQGARHLFAGHPTRHQPLACVAERTVVRARIRGRTKAPSRARSQGDARAPPVARGGQGPP